jgi:hypothetical protein
MFKPCKQPTTCSFNCFKSKLKPNLF